MKKLISILILGAVVAVGAQQIKPARLLGPTHTIGLEDGTRIIIEAEYAMTPRAMTKLLREAVKIMEGTAIE